MSHWFPWFPGDHLRDTQHLSMIEDAAYRRMIDSYYMVERLSANAEILLRVCRAVTPDEQAAVRKVAGEFFEERDGYLYHEKIEQGIAKSRAVSGKRSDAGKRGAAKTNGKRATNAPTNAAASDAANAAAKAPAIVSSIPQPEVNPIPTTSGATAPPASDPIFGHGLELLKAKGCTEKSARSFLGLMRKNHGDALVVEAIGKAEAGDVSDPIPWLRKYLESTPQATVRHHPAPENFSSRNYGTGGPL